MNAFKNIAEYLDWIFRDAYLGTDPKRMMRAMNYKKNGVLKAIEKYARQQKAHSEVFPETTGS